MLTRRIPHAVFANHVTIRVPESWPSFTPTKPYIDMWDPERVAAM